MTLNQYQELAKSTDCRADETKMIINGFGLIGELEELNSVPFGDNKNIIKESGDVLWYCASICGCLGENLQDVYDRKKEDELDKPIAEVFKKALRDNEGKFDGKYKEDILNFISKVINCQMPHDQNSLSKVMETNIDKLCDRIKRGVIRGDGDDR